MKKGQSLGGKSLLFAGGGGREKSSHTTSIYLIQNIVLTSLFVGLVLHLSLVDSQNAVLPSERGSSVVGKRIDSML